MTPESIRAVTDWVQVINVIMALAILVLALDAGRRWPGARVFLVGPVTFAAHSLIYYSVVIFELADIGPFWNSLWSATLRLHGYLFLLGTLLAFYVVAFAPDAGPDGAADDGL